MKTVVCFDSWTVGAHNFARLAPEFKRIGYNLLLIHIGSWGHDKERPKEELIGEMLVRDISYYKNISFDKILIQENPSAVIFLSTRAFAHLAFNRYSHHMDIPTCHLYHGLVAVLSNSTKDQNYKVSYFQQIQLILTRAWKNISHLVPSYIRSLIYTSAPKKNWIDLILNFFDKASGNDRLRFLCDSKTTIGCVYTNADVEHMEQNYGIPRTDIHVVGNPDFIKFGIHPQNIGSLFLQKSDPKFIVYIETGFLGTGFIYKSFKDFLIHICDTKKIVENAGYRFIIKLKPHSDILQSGLDSHLVENGIDILQDTDFINILKQSAGAIVEPTTAAMIPTALGLPIFLAAYGPFKNQAYGDVLMTYPKAHLIENLSELSEILVTRKYATDPNDFIAWSEYNLGPLPAEEMPKRVVDAVDQMIREHEQLCAG